MGCAVSCFRAEEDDDDEETETLRAVVALRDCIRLRCSTLAAQLVNEKF